jgi:hypothetical protein
MVTIVYIETTIFSAHCEYSILCLGLQLPPDCRLAAVFVAGLSLNGTFCEPVFCQQFVLLIHNFSL